jgi:hypothetical protein
MSPSVDEFAVYDQFIPGQAFEQWRARLGNAVSVNGCHGTNRQLELA